MKVFRTTFPKIESNFFINHGDNVMNFGSCFAQNISSKLTSYKFKCTSNPFGILYNPLSIAKSIDMIGKSYQFNDKDLIQNKGLWHSHWHHSEFSAPVKQDVISSIQSSLDQAHKDLHQTDIVILTFGTAYYYQHKESGINVGNCHKINADQFSKHRLSVDEIFESSKKVIAQISAINSNVKFVFTVSPIRHVKDGLKENSRSKSILHLATEKLVDTFENAFYFPSYEIIMDDLRGYQFYKEDLIHPNEQALEYVWQYFQDAFFEEDTKSLNKSIQQINNAVQHKALNVESEAHQNFLKNTLSKIEKIKVSTPSLNFSKETNTIQTQIKIA